MNFEEILEFIKKEHKRLLRFYNFENHKDIRYPIAVKIMEELGELSEQLLALDSIQRKEKLKVNKGKIEEEIADVLITTLLLAENLNIDVSKELTGSIEKRLSRWY